MNVEKMIKRDISVEIANYLTNNLPCYEKKNIDDEKTYETNFLHLMNVIGKNVINTVTSTLLQIEYPNQSTNNGASAVVGIVCDAMISGYNAFSATSLTSIRIASPSPSTTEIKSPIATTDMVAGRCAVKSGPLSSHNRTRICVGDGRMYAALIPIAAICQNIISAARRISAGRLAFPAFFLSLIRSPS